MLDEPTEKQHTVRLILKTYPKSIPEESISEALCSGSLIEGSGETSSSVSQMGESGSKHSPSSGLQEKFRTHISFTEQLLLVRFVANVTLDYAHTVTRICI